MQRDKAQITRVLNELLEDGYISKIANPEDRRSQLLRLSAKGKEIVTQLNAIERTANKAMTANLSNEDMHAFIRIANIMVDNLAANTAQ
jgi:DNA-binding MarR family transcriptional regulator